LVAGEIESRLSHAFINFIHDPEVAAENTNFLSYVCPNQSSYSKVDPELRNNPAVFLAPGVKAKCEVIEDLGAYTAKYNEMWDQIKAAD
jgi:spermidine/putrescine transport system substrate-binding protein